MFNRSLESQAIAIPYSFAKTMGLLVKEIKADSVDLWVRNDTKLQTLLEFQRVYQLTVVPHEI
jgi:hypothetical protein